MDTLGHTPGSKATGAVRVSQALKDVAKRVWHYKYIYLMLVPGLIFLVIFKYIPIYGLVLSFKEFMPKYGIMGSPWVGLDNFRYLWIEQDFWQSFFNTLIIAFMKILFVFPFPVFLAILINEIRAERYKKVLQTVYTFPHFLSWVVVSGMMFNLLSGSGAVNAIWASLGFDKINFLSNEGTFRWLLVGTEIWKQAGWSTIIYLAAIAGINQSLYEAATVDGANRLQKILHITWPCIKNVVVLMLIMRVGYMMDAGFMQIFNMYNRAVYDVADIIDTYIYRMSFERSVGFGITTAVGFFKGIVNIILLLTANTIAKKMGHSGIV
ncbi:MAG: ABC transporter permease subunit [Firmicutes bacterium]|nr:ABC transporter permease subunit [Bacillota bacterium]